GWTPPGGTVLDWGCGSGVAGRCVVEFFGAANFKTLRLFDRSSRAMQFAAKRAKEKFPNIAVETINGPVLRGDERVGLLVVSHVLNELDDAGRAELLALARRADAVLWVEPGTHADSRALIAMREALRNEFRVIAPCTHQAACGLLAAGQERHWCHHFAAPPRGVLGDADWVRFAKRAGVDLRGTPYSFIALERTGMRAVGTQFIPPGWSRVLGMTRIYKGFAKIFSCAEEGVCELELQKRDVPEVFKAMKDGEAGSTWRWETDGRRVKKCEPWRESS
ncbi:MAG: class I SAM-dependent methyltransferase, partial [Verrucomicrobia bacterium]|nr:class I SAM-dependent methyltransferase [Verrucomicrobiota bacterium]